MSNANNRFESCLKLTSGSVSLSTIRRQIEFIRQNPESEHQLTMPNHAFNFLIERNLQFINEEGKTALKEIDHFVVALPVYQALAMSPKTVVIGHGLLNLLTACGYWAHFCAGLPEEMDATRPLENFPSTSLREAVRVLMFFLIHRHYQNPSNEILPNFRALFNGESAKDADLKVKDAIAGAATFMLLHESGHLVLDHFSDEHQSSIPIFQSPVEQELNKHQFSELEADEFAYNSIKEPLRPLHRAWISMALNFHIQREVLISERTESHPNNINRLAYADLICGDDTTSPEDFLKRLHKMGKSFENIEANNRKLEARNSRTLASSFNRQEIIRTLKQLNRHLAPFRLDISPILDQSSRLPEWHQCFGASLFEQSKSME